MDHYKFELAIRRWIDSFSIGHVGEVRLLEHMGVFINFPN